MIPFSVTDVPLRAVMLPAHFLDTGVPVFEIRDALGMTDMLVKDAKRGKALAESLGGHAVALLRGHGDVVVGPNLRAATSRAVYTEANARIQMQAVMLAAGGRIEYMAAEECALREAGSGGRKERLRTRSGPHLGSAKKRIDRQITSPDSGSRTGSDE